MNTEEIIRAIHESKKTTPVKLYLREKEPIPFENVKSFGVGDRIVFGDWADIGPMLEKYADRIEDYVVESDRRNSAIPLLDAKNLRARIEPGAIIRDQVEIGDNAVVMMGAVINIGAVVGEGTMIDMGAVLGGRATVGKNCHVGAGAVLAGGIMAALFNRTRTGEGEKVTTSLYGTGSYAMYYTIASAYDGMTYPITRKEPAAIPLKNGFRCADGEWVYVSILDHERDWPKLCKMLGREDLAGDERFCTLAPAQRNCRALTDLLDEEFIRRTSKEWMELLAEYDLPYSPLPHAGEIYQDPQCLANRFVEAYVTRSGKTFMLPKTPVRFGDNVPAESRPAPRFGGEDTEDVLRSLGYTDDGIAALEAQKVVSVLRED